MKLRIDELAHRAGTTSRNVRAYQARGLLPPPTLDGRTGYYGEEHLRRLELIGDLQGRGFSLEAVRHTLDAWSKGGDLVHLVGLRNMVAAPASDEEPRTLTLEELIDRFPEAESQPALVDRALELGLLEANEDGAFVAPSPLLIDAGAELARAGIPLEAIFQLVEAVRPHVAQIAQHFVTLIRDHLTVPFLEGDAPAAQFDEVVESVGRLKPLALEVVRPFLARELQKATERAVEEHLGSLGQDAQQAG